MTSSLKMNNMKENMKNNKNKLITTVLLIVFAIGFKLYSTNNFSVPQARPAQSLQRSISTTSDNSEILKDIAQNNTVRYIEVSDLKVIQLLNDDTSGNRHQKWIAQFANGQKILGVYNIDLAEKIPLKMGDVIGMGGELVFNRNGGGPLMHWIHADPHHSRRDGYVLLNGKKYGALIQ